MASTSTLQQSVLHAQYITLLNDSIIGDWDRNLASLYSEAQNLATVIESKEKALNWLDSNDEEEKLEAKGIKRKLKELHKEQENLYKRISEENKKKPRTVPIPVLGSILGSNGTTAQEVVVEGTTEGSSLTN